MVDVVEVVVVSVVVERVVSEVPVSVEVVVVAVMVVGVVVGVVVPQSNESGDWRTASIALLSRSATASHSSSATRIFRDPRLQ